MGLKYQNENNKHHKAIFDKHGRQVMYHIPPIPKIRIYQNKSILGANFKVLGVHKTQPGLLLKLIETLGP